MMITLGSLFDGIGAFPYAASFFGITPLWASEILPNAVSITKRHFPNMEHLGDITKLNGGTIPPVRVLAFGSPCQSFSIAGKRTAFQGQSGLFYEAIRIIKEMRYATNGKFPEIVLFENVVGLLSVDSRRSFKAVLEAFCETEIPMPKSGRWSNAGMVRGRSIDLAWIIKDSQYYRTAQRRRRLFLVADFTERRCAGEILFVSQSLSGYFTARKSKGKGTASNPKSCTACAVTVLNDQGGNSLSIEAQELSPTLRSQAHGNLPIICPSSLADTVSEPNITYCLQGSIIGRQNQNGPQGSGINKEVSFSLTSTDRHYIAAIDCRNFSENKLSGTLQAKSTGGYSLNYQNPVRAGNYIRRLTPVECERLMSFDDGYTAIGHDGKEMSDSARYPMLGNSIVVNVLAYIMQNIEKSLKEKEPII